MSAQIATDPYWSFIELPTNNPVIVGPHGSGFVTGTSGLNWFMVTTRNVNATVIRFPANRTNLNSFTSFSYVLLDTNYNDSAPSFAVLNHQIYVLTSHMQVGGTHQDYSTITKLDPDTMSTNAIWVGTTNSFEIPVSGSIATDGTNLIAVGGYAVGKWDTNGNLLATNLLMQLPFTNTTFWIGVASHSIVWNGVQFSVTGNAINSFSHQNSVVMLNPDLTYYWLTINGTFFGVTNVNFTDDTATYGGWIFPGDEGGGRGAEWAVRTNDNLVVAIKTPFNTYNNYGNFWDGKYIWGEWADGYYSRFNPSDITNGEVRVDTFSLGNISVYSPGIGYMRPQLNELVVDTNALPWIYYGTSFETPAHAFRFSTPDLVTTTWSTTNLQYIQPINLFQIQ